MSIAGILDATRSKRPAGERLVWLCLENHANGHRFWRMTFEAIAAELQIGIRTVRRAVARLEADEIIEVERHKRRPSVFHMKRAYAKPNGHTPNSHAELSGQTDPSTTPYHAELRGQNDHSTDELTGQNGPSSAELRGQNGRTKTPPVRIHQKGKAPSGSAHARATPRKSLPEGWEPNGGSIGIGLDQGLTQDDIQAEAEKMRDWARHRGEMGADWDARFNNWLRKEASDRLIRRKRTEKPTLQQEWGLGSFLAPGGYVAPDFDDEPPIRPSVLLS